MCEDVVLEESGDSGITAWMASTQWLPRALEAFELKHHQTHDMLLNLANTCSNRKTNDTA